jgi:hypothetical protein
MILWPFIDFAEEGGDELARFLIHVGIEAEDIQDGDVERAILRHYKTTDGYDITAVAHDLSRWPPIAARIRELRREQKQVRRVSRRSKD